jgi:MoaA/NifB/PqqE/SkfB family radical SAM enzyme
LIPAPVTAPPDPVIIGPQQAAVKWRMWARVVVLALRHGGGPLEGVRALRAFVAERGRDRNHRAARKYVRAGGRHFWDLYSPGFPSLALDRFVADALERLHPRHGRPAALQTVVIAVTADCPLACAHCCEALVAAGGRRSSPSEVRATLAALQSRGVAQVFLSGGEPLVHFDELLALLGSARAGTDFWLFTSGWGLTTERARLLRRAGVTGVALSLDHWREDAHDAFRGRAGSYHRAREAAAAAREADLALCLSLCATREFISADNLAAYARLARAWGAGFVQLLEPKPVGRWHDQDVRLDEGFRRQLEAFFRAANYDPALEDLPVVAYLDLLQRRVGCLGAGYRYLYVDSSGGVHPCPFCRAAVGRLPDDRLDLLLARLARGGCPATYGPPRLEGPRVSPQPTAVGVSSDVAGSSRSVSSRVNA